MVVDKNTKTINLSDSDTSESRTSESGKANATITKEKTEDIYVPTNLQLSKIPTSKIETLSAQKRKQILIKKKKTQPNQVPAANITEKTQDQCKETRMTAMSPRFHRNPNGAPEQNT